MRLAVLAVALALVGAASIAAARGHGHRDQQRGTPGRFDYYLMSLSWSPSFCETHPGESEQCGKQGFGFVLHGLWPQYRNGSWPQQCRSAAGAPDEQTIRRTLAFMPSRHLIEHEWDKHGTCTGLDAQAYFELADRAFASVAVPEALRAPRTPPQLSAAALIDTFIDANPSLHRNMISVECREGELTEVHVCLSKDTLVPQNCGGRLRNTCRAGTLRIPAVR